jgi:ribose 5-phosphate isomerase A
MRSEIDPQRDLAKRQAADRALELVRDGMTIGIGTGSTARFFIEGLGRRVAAGLGIRGLATSIQSANLARAAGVPLLDDLETKIDLAIDGADEVDSNLNLIKGRGGALLREKLVVLAARRFIVIVDDSKLVPALGQGRLPVDVVPFLWQQTAARISSLGLDWDLRGGRGAPFVTDDGHLVLDVSAPGGIADPVALAATLKAEAGVVEHGLFLGLAAGCIAGTSQGLRVLGHLE